MKTIFENKSTKLSFFAEKTSAVARKAKKSNSIWISVGDPLETQQKLSRLSSSVKRRT